MDEFDYGKKPHESKYSVEALSKPDLYESDEVVKKAAKIVIDAFYPEGEMSRGDWKKKVRSGGEAERVKDFLDREGKKDLIAKANLAPMCITETQPLKKSKSGKVPTKI